jgi:hypothetical protein
MTQKSEVAERAGYLLISWDSLGHWFFRVARDGLSRRVTLTEIRRKNRHSVPEWWMVLNASQPQLDSRKSGEGLGRLISHSFATCLPDRRSESRSDCLAGVSVSGSCIAWIESHSSPSSFRKLAQAEQQAFPHTNHLKILVKARIQFNRTHVCLDMKANTINCFVSFTLLSHPLRI